MRGRRSGTCYTTLRIAGRQLLSDGTKRFVMSSEEMKPNTIHQGVEVDAANYVGQAEQSFYTEIYCSLVSYFFPGYSALRVR